MLDDGTLYFVVVKYNQFLKVLGVLLKSDLFVYENDDFRKISLINLLLLVGRHHILGSLDLDVAGRLEAEHQQLFGDVLFQVENVSLPTSGFSLQTHPLKDVLFYGEYMVLCFVIIEVDLLGLVGFQYQNGVFELLLILNFSFDEECVSGGVLELDGEYAAVVVTLDDEELPVQDRVLFD